MQKQHSNEYFGDQRNYWWNTDFLELMSRRLNFSNKQTVLDLGCGVGHWGQLIAQFLPSNCAIIGVDKEKRWIAEAGKRAADLELSNCEYQEGNAESLDFLSDSFDMVTCQTLLIHVNNPEQVVNEMYRILKPGGVMLLVEPNNLARNFIMGSKRLYFDIDDLLSVAKFQFICEKGKINSGKGDNSLGDILNGILMKSGLNEIKTYLSDKAFSFAPPYTSQTEISLLKQEEEWRNREFWIWDKDETKEYYLAGNGDQGDFEKLWKKAIEMQNKLYELIHSKKYMNAGGAISYIFSGIKPRNGNI